MVDGGFDTSFETRIRGGGGKNNIEEKAELGKNGVEKQIQQRNREEIQIDQIKRKRVIGLPLAFNEMTH